MLFYLRTSASVYEKQLGGLPPPPPLQLLLPAPLPVFSPTLLLFCLNLPSIILGMAQQVTTCVLYCLRHVHSFINYDSQLTLTQLFLPACTSALVGKPKPGGDHRAGFGQPRKMGDHLVIKQQVINLKVTKISFLVFNI